MALVAAKWLCRASTTCGLFPCVSINCGRSRRNFLQNWRAQKGRDGAKGPSCWARLKTAINSPTRRYYLLGDQLLVERITMTASTTGHWQSRIYKVNPQKGPENELAIWLFGMPQLTWKIICTFCLARHQSAGYINFACSLCSCRLALSRPPFGWHLFTTLIIRLKAAQEWISDSISHELLHGSVQVHKFHFVYGRRQTNGAGGGGSEV